MANSRPQHDAIQCLAHGDCRAFGACSWEIYGDWTNDEAKLETQVIYLLVEAVLYRFAAEQIVGGELRERVS